MSKTTTTITTVTTTTTALGNAFTDTPTDKRIEILRFIAKSGSISQAARDAGVSYKAAWQVIDTLSNLAGVALVERAVGGLGGGGARITVAGEKLLSIADLLGEARKQVFGLSISSELLLTRPNPVLPRIGIRFRMHNKSPCTVEMLQTRGQVVRMYLQLAEGATLVARITRASAELLGLKKNLPVLALFKATAVRIMVGCLSLVNEKFATQETLFGQVMRINRGTAGDEVSLQLDSGFQLVGFAPAASGIRSKTAISALVGESAVVIALAN